jgi:hypothetical protein
MGDRVKGDGLSAAERQHRCAHPVEKWVAERRVLVWSLFCRDPWEEWGPAHTRILEHDSLVGERRATVGQVSPTRTTMRDYNPFRVRRALALAGAGQEVTLECGSVVKVVKDRSTYRGGEWFCDDIETSLPYVETVTPYPGCEGIFMDEDNLLAEERTEVGPHMHLSYTCVDDGEASFLDQRFASISDLVVRAKHL